MILSRVANSMLPLLLPLAKILLSLPRKVLPLLALAPLMAGRPWGEREQKQGKREQGKRKREQGSGSKTETAGKVAFRMLGWNHPGIERIERKLWA